MALSESLLFLIVIVSLLCWESLGEGPGEYEPAVPLGASEEITLSFTKTLYTVNEDSETAKLELVLSEPICSTISVYVIIQQITAIKGEDYEVKGGNCDNETCTIQTLFPGGKTSATFDVKIKPDERLESNESFNVSIHPLSLPHCVVLGDITTAEVIILDNDVANVSFETIRYDVNEGDGQVELALNLSHPLPLEFNASLRLNAIDDTNDTNATFISTEILRCDYKDGVITIPAHVTTFKYNFAIFDDDVLETDETINLVIDSANHNQIRIINPYKALVTIKDNEERITVSFSEEEFTFNEADGIATPVLTLSKPSPCCLNLYVEVEDVTAFGGGVDYGEKENNTQIANDTQYGEKEKIANDTQNGNKTQYLVTFPAGTNCSSVDIPINNDIISEDNETFNISILIMSLPFGIVLGGIYEAKVVIMDDDIELNFSSTVYEIYEDGGQFCFTLTLTKPAISNIENITANKPGDYSYEGGSPQLNFTKGDISTMFCINIIDDKDLEEDETFTLTINDTKSDHNHVILTDPYMVHVTIIDDEYTFCFDEENYIVSEGNNLTLVINLSKPLPNDIMVRFEYPPLSATANKTNELNETNKDYYTQYHNFTAEVKKNTSYFLLNITIVDDNELEDNETFRVVAIPLPLDEIPHMHTYCSATVTIEDNDYPVLEFENRSYAVNTKNYPEVPLLTLHCPDIYAIARKTFPIKVNVSEIDGTATGGRTDDDDGADYVYQNYTYVFESCGEEAKKLIIRPLDDNLVEPDETYNLTIKLVSQNPYVKIGKNGTTTITIYNDDVCFIKIVRKNRRHQLYFSKPLQLSTNVTIYVTDTDGNNHTIEKTKENYYIELPVSKKRIRKIQVYIPVSLKPYVEVTGKKNMRLITLEYN